MKTAAVAVLLLFWPALAAADPGWYPERRRSQFPRDPGHIALPYLFNLPGLGWGYGALAAATNVGGTCADVSGTLFAGDIGGAAVGVDSIHLVPERLVLDLGGAYLTRASVQSYKQRGMASGKDDYAIAEFQDSYYGGSRATATFLDRRLEAYVGVYGGRIRLASIRDRDGVVIVEAENAPTARFHTWVFGGRVDFTDDSQDPRRGVRFEASLWRSPRSDSGPDTYTTDYNLTAYLPLARRSTWAFTYFRSDAHVLDRGETDPAVIAGELGLECETIAEPVERQECRDYLAGVVAENTYGTATSLGGLSRLRSYPSGRFSGAHTQFAGTEVRWNITDEMTPFDIFLVKDIRTSVQVALFYEIGTVADEAGELWTATRSSYGAGLRIVTASGVVYRVDLAVGEEGFAPSVFFQYPWEI